VNTERDNFGNVIACYRRGESSARYAIAAHMDHPGFVGDEFLGGVPEEYRAKSPPRRDFGAFSMWDLPAFEFRDGRIYSRACDDLIGCATIVAAFYELERMGSNCTFYGIFTRAEEVGFVGAIQLARAGRLPRDLTVISLETSSEKGGLCKMGDGVIIRVGDRTTVFDPDVSLTLTELAKKREIRHQRALMSGGTCEATPYRLYGYRVGALCVALGNYHNCGPDTTIAPEFVAMNDFEAMVRLCVELARADAEPSDAATALRERLEKRVEEYRRFF
jgi:endoglucanase